MKNNRNMIRVEKKTLSMKIKFMDKMIGHLIKMNKSSMNALKGLCVLIINSSIFRGSGADAEGFY